MTTTSDNRSTIRSSAVTAVLFVAVACYAAACCVNHSRVVDLFWQLRTGQLIASQGHAPLADTYSYTRFHHHWVAHEWLTFLLFWTAYRIGGYGGVWFVTTTIVTVALLNHYRLMLRETAQAGGSPAPLTAFFLTTFAALVASPLFQPRPQAVTYLLSTVTLGILLQARRLARASGTPPQPSPQTEREKVSDLPPLAEGLRGGQASDFPSPIHGEGWGDDGNRASIAYRRRLWFLAPVFALWANLHAGVLVGVGLLFLFAIGDSICIAMRVKAAKQGGAMPSAGEIDLCKTLWLVAPACVTATLMTPYSFHEYQNFVDTITNDAAMSTVHEWSSPNFHELFGTMVEVMIAVFAYAIFCTRLRHDPTELAVTAFFIHESLSALRNIPLSALIVTLLLGRHFQSAITWHIYRGKQQASALFGGSPPLAAVVAVVAVTAFACIARVSAILSDSAPSQGSLITRAALASISYGTFPEHACNFIERERFPASMRMYNSYGDGGFLIWKLPNHPVFVDSRADVYFGSLLGEVRTMLSAPYTWRTVVDAHRVDFIVISSVEPQSRLFLAAPDWALVYVDSPDIVTAPYQFGTENNTMIFVRRSPLYRGLINRCRRDCPAVTAMKNGPFQEYAALQ